MTTREENEKWMRRCLALARGGETGAPPNPMVGSVIVHEGRIIGEGYHIRCGGPHAEVNAIQSVRPEDRPLLPEATLYVNLEPCAHYGRTPPCAELIVRTGIGHVVVGCVDPFARVEGRGIGILREAGVEVTVGVLEEECRQLNRRFITFHTARRPFITLKWARSADGFIDAWRLDDAVCAEDDTPCDSGNPVPPAAPATPAQLSTAHTLMHVHRLRTLHQAILVGHATLRLDHPSLTVRHWHGPAPLRLVLGRVAEGELPAGFEAFADVDTMLKALHRRGIQSLLVEGGTQTLQSFIDRGLWDEAWEELSDTELGSGVPVPRMPVGPVKRSLRRWGVEFSHWTNG